jgi:hypothetical protein
VTAAFLSFFNTVTTDNTDASCLLVIIVSLVLSDAGTGN